MLERQSTRKGKSQGPLCISVTTSLNTALGGGASVSSEGHWSQFVWGTKFGRICTHRHMQVSRQVCRQTSSTMLQILSIAEDVWRVNSERMLGQFCENGWGDGMRGSREDRETNNKD